MPPSLESSPHRREGEKPPETGRPERPEKAPETQEAGIKILADNSREISVAVYAGERYSRQSEAARVDLELFWQNGQQHARVSHWSQTGFAAGSGALRRAINATEARAAQRGVRTLAFDLPDHQAGQLPSRDRSDLASGLRQDGYRVYDGALAASGYDLQARKALSPQRVPPAGEVRLPAPDAEQGKPTRERPPGFQGEAVEGQPLPEEDTPLEGEINTMLPRFESEQQVQEYVERALYEINQTRSGRRFVNHLPAGIRLRNLVQAHSEHDVLTRTAALAQDAHLGPAATGSLVHRISELRQLHHHPDEVLSGKRRTEQKIEFSDENGELHRVELDTVTVRGDHHVIRDNKPVNLAEFESTTDGARWAGWMERNFGDDFRQQIRMGELMPFAQRRKVDTPLDKEVHAALRDFLAGQAARHHQQLESYRQHYARAAGVPLQQVRAVVRPYFTYRS